MHFARAKNCIFEPRRAGSRDTESDRARDALVFVGGALRESEIPAGASDTFLDLLAPLPTFLLLNAISTRVGRRFAVTSETRSALEQALGGMSSATVFFLADLAPVLERWAPYPRDLPALAPAWPAQVAPSAACCGPPARRALVDALDALRTPWSQAILARAVREDPDAAVQQRAAAALAG